MCLGCVLAFRIQGLPDVIGPAGITVEKLVCLKPIIKAEAIMIYPVSLRGPGIRESGMGGATCAQPFATGHVAMRSTEASAMVSPTRYAAVISATGSSTMICTTTAAGMTSTASATMATSSAATTAAGMTSATAAAAGMTATPAAASTDAWIVRQGDSGNG